MGATPVARIVAMAAHAQAPKDFTTAPVGAITKLLDKAGWTIADVDLFEVNEAFACVAMFAMHDLGIPHDKINVHGGATALGHPIGASGTRIIVTLINALKTQGKKRGVASALHRRRRGDRGGGRAGLKERREPGRSAADARFQTFAPRDRGPGHATAPAIDVDLAPTALAIAELADDAGRAPPHQLARRHRLLANFRARLRSTIAHRVNG